MENKNLHLKHKTKVSNFVCKIASCDDIVSYLESDFFDDMILEKGLHPYDLPSATRMLLGALDYLQDFNSRDYETSYIMAQENSLAMFFNCKKSSIMEVLEKPVQRSHSEVSLSQNLLDNLGFPNDVVFSTDEILENPKIKDHP